MAVPKKKSSKSRRNMRRYSAAYQLDKPTSHHCPNCNELKRPHTVCSDCGFYEGKAVVAPRKQQTQLQA
jgi:large subunit ribosomal protein L32